MLLQKKIKSLNAQSVIEYSLLLIFVMGAVLVMGDYVKGSMFGQFKTLELSAEQSALEEVGLLELPDGVIKVDSGGGSDDDSGNGGLPIWWVGGGGGEEGN